MNVRGIMYHTVYLVSSASLRNAYKCIMHNVHTLVLDSLYVLVGVPRRDPAYVYMSRRDNRDMISRSPTLIRNRSRS